MAWDLEELAIDGWRYAGLANTTLPAAVGEFNGDPARPGVDDIVADIDTLGGLRSKLRRGVLLASGGDCAPSIAGTQVEIASGAVLLDGRLYLSPGATVATFSSVGTNYVYVTHTVTNGVGTAELVASTTPPTAPYVLLATVEWDGSALSDLTDRRGEHQVPSAAGTDWDSWTVGDGTAGADKYVLLDTGDALLPGLRYNVADSQLEYSHDGETWTAFGADAGGGSYDLLGDTGAVTIEDGDALNVVGADNGLDVAVSKVGTDITAALDLLLASDRPGLEQHTDSYSNVRWRVKRAVARAAIPFLIDGGGEVIGTGIKGDIEVPFDCWIESWTLLADQAGGLTIDVWRDTLVNFPPTDADSLCGGNEPALNAIAAYRDTTLTGWTRSLAEGDILRFNVDSCTGITRVTLSLKVIRG